MIDDFFLSLLLSPLLIPQAIYTKKTTLKLDEPEGKRKGQRGKGDTLKLLILGDSAAAGVGASHQKDALSGQLVEQLSKHYRLDWRLEAESGVTTAGILNKLDALDSFETDIVLISLGVNDVTSKIRRKNWLEQQDQLKQLLMRKFKAKYILFSCLPPMHKFPALPQPLRWFLGRRAKAFNHALETKCQALDEFEFLSVSFPMEKEYFAVDGFHPSKAAYQLWSEVVVARLLSKHSADILRKD